MTREQIDAEIERREALGETNIQIIERDVDMPRSEMEELIKKGHKSSILIIDKKEFEDGYKSEITARRLYDDQEALMEAEFFFHCNEDGNEVFDIIISNDEFIARPVWEEKDGKDRFIEPLEMMNWTGEEYWAQVDNAPLGRTEFEISLNGDFVVK